MSINHGSPSHSPARMMAISLAPAAVICSPSHSPARMMAISLAPAAVISDTSTSSASAPAVQSRTILMGGTGGAVPTDHSSPHCMLLRYHAIHYHIHTQSLAYRKALFWDPARKLRPKIKHQSRHVTHSFVHEHE